MPDREKVIKGCEYWVNNHKDEDLLIAYSSVVELLAILKDQKALLDELLKEQDELLKHEYWRGYNNGRADERGLQEGTIMQTFSPD